MPPSSLPPVLTISMELAVRLATETGITTSDEMLDLLSAAYPHRLLTPRIEYNAREVARAVQDSPPPTRGE